MKNLKAQFKLIICLFLLLNIPNIISAKKSDKFSDAKNISNYFSGVLSINNNQYKKSHYYLKSLSNLEDSHYVYSQYFHYSLVALKKFRYAASYSKKLEEKKLDNFESNLISAIYFLENKDFDKAKFYFEKIKNKKSQPGTIKNLVSISLNSWINFKNITDLNSALDLLETIPKRYKNIKKIQKTFAYCYYDSPKTDEIFKKLTSSPDINHSRYNFFHANYLVSKHNEKKAKEILQSSLDLFPRNLILNQLKIDLEKRKIFNNQFDCKNPADIIAEILYIVANGLASQENYIASNFYLNLAKYLNPYFVSYEILYAENFFIIKKYDEAKNIYDEIKEHGPIYTWHASKQIALIFIRQEKKKEAISYLKKSFKKITNPTTYEILDYAEFLKNNEKHEESIKYYSKVLNLIDKKHNLYAETLYGRGVSYEQTNQWDKAETDLLNSLSVSSNDAYVINYLAYSWIEKGINLEKSLGMLKKANELIPNNGYIIDSLGWALFKLKNYKEAKKYLELAIRYKASDPVVNDHYADILWMNNNSLQARYYWNYVLKLEKTEEKLKKEIEQKLLFGLKS